MNQHSLALKMHNRNRVGEEISGLLIKGENLINMDPLVFDPHAWRVDKMAMLRLCKFYKDTRSLNTDQSLGYCELDCDETTCTGDIDACPRTDSLKRYFFEQIRRGGDFEWERRVNTFFSKDAKA